MPVLEQTVFQLCPLRFVGRLYGSGCARARLGARKVTDGGSIGDSIDTNVVRIAFRIVRSRRQLDRVVDLSVSSQSSSSVDMWAFTRGKDYARMSVLGGRLERN
jgi:hypothetical protein